MRDPFLALSALDNERRGFRDARVGGRNRRADVLLRGGSRHGERRGCRACGHDSLRGHRSNGRARAVSATAAPLPGAGAVSVTVPITGVPPTTVERSSVMVASAGAETGTGVTVNVAPDGGLQTSRIN